LRKPNYRHAKRQKEEQKKTRRLEKDQRRADRTPPADGVETDAASLTGEPVDSEPAGESSR
jgi:hypothetical protein